MRSVSLNYEVCDMLRKSLYEYTLLFLIPNKLTEIMTFFAIFTLQNFTMIQRIQSVYLLLLFTLQLIAIFVIEDWLTASGSVSLLTQQPLLLAAIVVSAGLSLFSLFKYANRKLQFVLNRLNSLLHLVILVVFVIRVFSLEDPTFGRPISLFVPILSIGLLFLANKAIKKDEELIRSVDRIR